MLPNDPRQSPLVVFSGDAFITPLRYEDEPARHKMVDLIGDLSLVGHRVIADIIVSRPGHCFNASIAKRLRAEAGL
jgi:UDP-3-O-[3-hydroxymyristoyl] N-acetylglucosamine deacetylase/3-hydroxyacyl-[acyl-carrier-protein] dehydratase